MYAIVRAGGRQEKVSVGDTLLINSIKGEAGDSVDLAARRQEFARELADVLRRLREVERLDAQRAAPKGLVDPHASADGAPGDPAPASVA